MAVNEKAVGLDFYVDTWNSNKDDVAKVGLIVAFNDAINTLKDYRVSITEDEVGALELDIHNYIKCLKEAFDFDINMEYIDDALKLLSTVNKSLYGMRDYRDIYGSSITPVMDALHANLEYFIRMLGIKIQTSYDSLCVIPVKSNTVTAGNILINTYRDFTTYTATNQLHDLEDCVINLAKCTVAEVTRIIGEDINNIIDEVTKGYMSHVHTVYMETLEQFKEDVKYLDYAKTFDHLEDALTDWLDNLSAVMNIDSTFIRSFVAFKENLIEVGRVYADEYEYNLLWDLEVVDPSDVDDSYIENVSKMITNLQDNLKSAKEILDVRNGKLSK